MDIEAFSESVQEDSLESSQTETLDIGTKDNPVPLRFKLDPIYQALDEKYWSDEDQAEVPDLETKQNNVQQAYLRYGEIHGVDFSGES